MSQSRREQWEEEIAQTFPESGRPIRIKPTNETRRMGIAGWEGFRQGDVSPYCWWFAHRNALPGDSKVGMPWGIQWWYIRDRGQGVGDLPDPIDHCGRWYQRDGKMYKSVFYWGGSYRWVPEGSIMHSGPANGPVTRVWRLRFTRWERFKEFLRGGPLLDRR